MILFPFTVFDADEPPSWSPLLLGDKLLAWWDATDASTFSLTGDLVNSWTDKKNGFVLTASGSERPARNSYKMNGTPSVVFSGAQKLSTGADAAFFDTPDYNTFAAAMIDPSAPEWCRLLSYIASGDGNSWGSAGSAILICREPPTSKAICSFSNSVQRSSKDMIALGIPSVLEYYRRSGTGLGIAAVDAVDGTSTAVVGAMGATGQFNIGSDAALANPLVGMVTSVIVTRNTPSDLSDDDRANIQGFMAWQSSLQRNLPALHKWKSTSPIHVNPLPVARPRITFFYGADPAAVEGINDTTLAGQYFAANFDHIVLGQGLQDPAHPGHANAIAVVAAAVAVNPSVKFYGYLHMSQDPGIPPNYNDAQLIAQAGQWLSLVKTHGVFLDECEVGFQTYMASINAVLDSVHAATTFYGAQGRAIINGWDHSYFYSGTVVATYNPLGLKAHILPIDMTCMESQTYNDSVPLYLGNDNASAGSDGYVHGHFLFSQGAAGLVCRNYFQCGFCTVNVFDPDITPFDSPGLQVAWDFCQRVAKIYGNTATGLCVKDFGASGTGAGHCPAFTYDSDYSHYISSNPVVAAETANAVANGEVLRYSDIVYISTLHNHSFP